MRMTILNKVQKESHLAYSGKQEFLAQFSTVAEEVKQPTRCSTNYPGNSARISTHNKNKHIEIT